MAARRGALLLALLLASLCAWPLDGAPNRLARPWSPATDARAAVLGSTTASEDELALAEQVAATVRATVRPPADRFRLAEQVRAKTAEPIARVVNPEPPDYPVGHRQLFWVHDDEDARFFQVEAQLVHKSEHAYFYFQTDNLPDASRVAAAADRFEELILPTNRRYFGEHSLPGVDNDPRITVLAARVPGVGGYYSLADEFPRAVNPYSNERRIIYMNRESARPGARAFESTIAHEYQHMIHFNEHPGDLSWVKEGLAQLAEKLNRYSVGGVARSFLSAPDLQLNTWSGGSARLPHYGASLLFADYFFSHYGGHERIPLYLKQPLSGRAGFDAYLAAIGRAERFDDVFADWTVANLVDDRSFADGRYGYLDGLPGAISRFDTLSGEASAEVHQYAARYYSVEARGDVRLEFAGSRVVPMLPLAPPSGRGLWWSNRGDGTDTTLTREIDLTGVSRATLNVKLWWDLEDGWDYAYVMASADGGRTWDTLAGRHTTDRDPQGANLGVGYTGRSGGGPTAEWVDEQIDLGPYAGRRLLLRFEQVTDASLNLPGLAWDDLSIPEIGLSDDAEADGAWASAGFIHLGNALPQRFWVQVVTRGPGGYAVQRLPLDAANRGALTLRGLGSTVERAWVVVAAGAERTTEPASFTLALTHAD